MEWVVSTMDLFLSKEELCRIFQRYLLAMGSTPAEGSSRKTSDGLPTKDMATHNFLLFPPLSFYDLTSLYSSNCKFFK